MRRSRVLAARRSKDPSQKLILRSVAPNVQTPNTDAADSAKAKIDSTSNSQSVVAKNVQKENDLQSMKEELTKEASEKSVPPITSGIYFIVFCVGSHSFIHLQL